MSLIPDMAERTICPLEQREKSEDRPQAAQNHTREIAPGVVELTERRQGLQGINTPGSVEQVSVVRGYGCRGWGEEGGSMGRTE